MHVELNRTAQNFDSSQVGHTVGFFQDTEFEYFPNALQLMLSFKNQTSP